MVHPGSEPTHHFFHYQRGKALKSKKKKIQLMPAEVVESRRPKHFVLIADSIRRTYEQLIMEESRKAHFNSNPDDGSISSINIEEDSSSTAVDPTEITLKNNEEIEKNRQIYVRLPRSPLTRAKVQLPAEVGHDEISL